MSYGALALGAMAAHIAEPTYDDEFGLHHRELGLPETLEVRWGLYRSEGAGVILRPVEVRAPSVSEILDAALGA